MSIRKGKRIYYYYPEKQLLFKIEPFFVWGKDRIKNRCVKEGTKGCLVAPCTVYKLPQHSPGVLQNDDLLSISRWGLFGVIGVFSYTATKGKGITYKQEVLNSLLFWSTHAGHSCARCLAF